MKIKNTTILLLSTLAFCSCSSLKKISNSLKTNSKTETVTSKNAVDLKKKDSVYTGTTKEESKIVSDSGYKKTTIIKEVYSDEFDFDTEVDTSNNTNNDFEKNVAKPEEYFEKPQGKTTTPTKKPAGKKLLTRETTIIEEGKLTREENKNVVNDQTGGVSQSDSSAKSEDQKTKAKEKAEEKSSLKIVKKFLPGFGIAVAILLLIIGVFKYYKIANPFTKLTTWLFSKPNK